MRRIRFTIASLLVVVLFLAVGFAALRESSDLWDSSIFTITLSVLSLSILLAVHRTDTRCAFWLGFALFGWAYLGLSLIPSIESRLLTTKGLAFLDSKLPRLIPTGDELWYIEGCDKPFKIPFIVANWQSDANKGNGTFQDVTEVVGLNYAGHTLLHNPSGLWLVGTTENFMRIGHSLFALIAAFLGGQLSRRLYTPYHEAVQATTSDGSRS